MPGSVEPPASVLELPIESEVAEAGSSTAMEVLKCQLQGLQAKVDSLQSKQEALLEQLQPILDAGKPISSEQAPKLAVVQPSSAGDVQAKFQALQESTGKRLDDEDKRYNELQLRYSEMQLMCFDLNDKIQESNKRMHQDELKSEKVNHDKVNRVQQIADELSSSTEAWKQEAGTLRARVARLEGMMGDPAHQPLLEPVPPHQEPLLEAGFAVEPYGAVALKTAQPYLGQPAESGDWRAEPSQEFPNPMDQWSDHGTARTHEEARPNAKNVKPPDAAAWGLSKLSICGGGRAANR